MIISLINYKGGVGKTTLAANIAACLAMKGRRVLLIDLDPQASLTFSFMKIDTWIQKFKNRRNIKTLFDAYTNDRVPPSRQDLTVELSEINNIYRNMHLHLIPSHRMLPKTEIELAALMDSRFIRRKQIGFVTAHSILARFLNSVGNDYDYVFIDCPPNLNITTKNALVASDFYLTPAKLDYMSTVGITELITDILQLQTEYNSIVEKYNLRKKKISPELLGIICTMVGYFNGNIIKTNQEYLRQVEGLHQYIFKNSTRENKTNYGTVAEYGFPLIMKKDKDPTCTELRREIESITYELEEGLFQHGKRTQNIKRNICHY